MEMMIMDSEDLNYVEMRAINWILSVLAIVVVEMEMDDLL